MQIRGHHLLCLLGFQGRGYSDHFVRTTALLQKKYLGDTELTVRLVETTDDSCQACPHQQGLTCQKDGRADERMRARDHAVFNRLGLIKNSEHTNHQLKTWISQNYIFKSDAHDSCQDCEWQSDCLWYKSLKD